MSEFKDILILGEIIEEKLSGMTLELLGCSRKLADKSQQNVLCILIGSDPSNHAKAAIYYGADRVLIVKDASLQKYQPELYSRVMIEIVNSVSPSVILMGQNDTGRDLAPRLGFKLGTGCSMDCIDLDIDPANGMLVQTRNIYGGNILCKLAGDKMPQITTVRQKAMQALPPDENRKGEITELAIRTDVSKTTIKTLGISRDESSDTQGIKLEDATIIISGGRGIGSADGFIQLEELAGILKGAVGATRPPCDGGWVPATRQIGLTGKIVAPDLYIAIAVSGSSQHLAGCSGSRVIVAINRDPEANIFRISNYGAVGDWKQILPAFKDKIAELCR